VERIERTVSTPDGRTLAVQEAGDPAGRPVVVFLGTPNTRHLYGPHAADAASRGLRLICYDRPGYGGSTPQPGRTHADCAADVRAICATLGLARIAVWGISGGGAYALAAAALLPDLVVAAASLGGTAPCDADGLDWFDGMGKDNADSCRLCRVDPAAARARLDADREMLLAAAAPDLAAGLSSLFSPVDATVFTGELADWMLSWREGVAPGSEGWWEDARAVNGPWGFELSSISVPVLVAHGRHDQFAPFAHGQWLAAHIPGAQAWLRDDDGHLTLYDYRVPEVHAWLSDRLSGAPAAGVLRIVLGTPLRRCRDRYELQLINWIGALDDSEMDALDDALRLYHGLL